MHSKTQKAYDYMQVLSCPAARIDIQKVRAATCVGSHYVRQAKVQLMAEEEHARIEDYCATRKLSLSSFMQDWNSDKKFRARLRGQGMV